VDGPRTIDAIYAYIVVNDDGTEHVPAILLPEWEDVRHPVLLPLVAADTARMNALRRHIVSDPQLKGKTIKLAKFEQRQIVDVIERRDDR